MRAESKMEMIVNIGENQDINIISADRKKQVVTWSVLIIIVSFLLWFNSIKEQNEIDDFSRDSQVKSSNLFEAITSR